MKMSVEVGEEAEVASRAKPESFRGICLIMDPRWTIVHLMYPTPAGNAMATLTGAYEVTFGFNF